MLNLVTNFCSGNPHIITNFMKKKSPDFFFFFGYIRRKLVTYSSTPTLNMINK